MHRCPEYAVDGQSHCSKHLSSRTPSSRVAHTWAWRKLRRQIIDEGGPPWTCAIGGHPIEDEARLELDHINAVDAGGDPFDRANVQISCRRCNRSKGARTEGKPHPRVTGRRPSRGRRRAPRSKSPWMTDSTDLPPAA